MASDIWLRTILIVRKETRCRHIGYSFRLAARVLLYAPSHRQDSTYHGLCYTSRGALAGTRNSSMGPPYEGSIRRPIAPWANALTTELHLAPLFQDVNYCPDLNSKYWCWIRQSHGNYGPPPLLWKHCCKSHRIPILWTTCINRNVVTVPVSHFHEKLCNNYYEYINASGI